MDYRQIGLRIRNERKKLNLTREKFAELLELSVNYVGQIERGEKKFSVETIFKISECLHVSLDYLIKGININQSATDNTEDSELMYLLDKCSKYETSLITDVVKAMLPHISEKKKDYNSN